MKNLLIVFSILISIPASYGIGNYEAGDTLFIWAYSGLTCRDAANIKSTKIASIPYGEYVVVENKDSSLVYELKEFGGFIMRGIWVKVRYKDTLQGYVFDGYLSTYPACHKQDIYNSGSIFGPGKRILRGHQPNNKYCPWEKDIHLFHNGAIVVDQCDEKGSSQTLEIPNFSFEEAYLLTFLNPKLYQQQKDGEVSHDKLMIEKQGRLFVNMSYGLTEYIFERKKDKIFIRSSSHC